MPSAFSVAVDDPTSADVVMLLQDHLAEVSAISPPESVHALDSVALRAPGTTLWTARGHQGVLLGCGALKQHDDITGEVKSMRTTEAARGRGVATALLGEVLAEARRRGLRWVKLETGTDAKFEPARRLYERHGFTECAPFTGYLLDPFSVYLELRL